VVFEILGYFLFKKGRDHLVWLWLTYHQMLLNTRNKNMYGSEVGISTVFEKFGHFLFQGRTWPPRIVMTYIPSDAPWHKEQVYSLGMENSLVLKNVPYCAPTRSPGMMTLSNLSLNYVWMLSCKFQLFSLCGSCDKDFKNIFSNVNKYKNSLPYCGPTWPLGAMLLKNLLVYYVRKLSCKFQLVLFIGSWEDFYNKLR
jgi:hypothetical protein